MLSFSTPLHNPPPRSAPHYSIPQLLLDSFGGPANDGPFLSLYINVSNTVFLFTLVSVVFAWVSHYVRYLIVYERSPHALYGHCKLSSMVQVAWCRSHDAWHMCDGFLGATGALDSMFDMV